MWTTILQMFTDHLLCAKHYARLMTQNQLLEQFILIEKRGDMYSSMYTLHNLLSWHSYLEMIFCRSVVNRQAKIKAKPKQSLNLTFPPLNFPLLSSFLG